MSTNEEALILVDAHVHIYDCFELGTLLDAAMQNFSRAASDATGEAGHDSSVTGVLLLTETRSCNWFAHARQACVKNQRLLASDQSWDIELTADKNALLARQNQDQQSAVKPSGDMIIYIVAGRQVVTAEGLELLALGTDQNFEDGQPVSSALKAVRDSDALPVFPWAVGKWLGKRGKILSELLSREATGGAADASPAELSLGDNSGRPIFWQNPSHFKQAGALHMHVLPGTDPLPFADEAKRVGSFGFIVHGSLSNERPVDDLKQLLRATETNILAFGQLEKPWRFIANQIRLRLA